MNFPDNLGQNTSITFQALAQFLFNHYYYQQKLNVLVTPLFAEQIKTVKAN